MHSLELHFLPGVPISFHVIGNVVIHLVGEDILMTFADWRG